MNRQINRSINRLLDLGLLLFGNSNDFDFHVGAQWQLLNGDTRSGWSVGGKVSAVDLVQFLEVCHVGQEDVDLDDLVQAAVAGGQDGLDVVEDLLGLVGDGAFDLFAVSGEWHLAADVEQVADLHPWTVRGGWRGGVLAKDLESRGVLVAVSQSLLILHILHILLIGHYTYWSESRVGSGHGWKSGQ